MNTPRSLCPSLALACLAAVQSARAAEAEVSFSREILPILTEQCFDCHGPDEKDRKAKLRLDVAEAALGKGESGEIAIVPGHSARSELMRRISSTDREEVMPPPKTKRKLTASQIATIQRWIDQGARWGKHWSFEPPTRPALPAAGGGGNPIDRFLQARLEKEGLAPAPEAPKETLLRRVYVDLIGLPPTRAHLHEFLTDTAPDAYERVVERLLNDPRHGERWGRHFMDIWRYSDWYGRRQVPDVWNSAPQVWRWRDWIVRSLNGDKGYDRMIAEMLAADEVAPEDDDARVATGYLVRNWYALNANQWMRDVVEHTGKAFLGLTFNCAHCHDHKYDPITREDYFRMRAFFEPIHVRQDRVRGEADPGPYQDYVYVTQRKPQRLGMATVFDKDAAAVTWLYTGGDERNRQTDQPPAQPGTPAFLGGAVQVRAVPLPLPAFFPGAKPFVRADELRAADEAITAATEKRKSAEAALAAADRKLSESAGCRPDQHAAETVAAAEAELALRLAIASSEAAATKRKSLVARIAADDVKFLAAKGDLAALAKAAGETERTLAVAQGRASFLEAEVAAGGARGKEEAAPAGKEREAATAERKKAEARVSTAKTALAKAGAALKTPATDYTPLTPIYPKESTGRRRALAAWLTDRANPLTARVAVNHLWLRHFQAPLVATVSDFGRSGALPTHPELLDWLAVELMENGWSLKHLHRLMVTSAAYRRVSQAVASGSSDPENRWYWRMNSRRMESEAVRDSLLHLAGRLDPRMGGQELENSEMAASRRRSLYFACYPEVGGKGELTGLFDAPDPNDCYQRTSSIVPQQALALTNSPLVHEVSAELARTLWNGLGAGERERVEPFVTAAFEQILARSPRRPELDECAAFLARQGKAAQAAKPGTDPEARARESLIRALFNHNEFVTVK